MAGRYREPLDDIKEKIYNWTTVFAADAKAARAKLQGQRLGKS